jgi:hypothetical protein
VLPDAIQSQRCRNGNRRPHSPRLLAGCGLSLLLHLITVAALIRHPEQVAAAALDAADVTIVIELPASPPPPIPASTVAPIAPGANAPVRRQHAVRIPFPLGSGIPLFFDLPPARAPTRVAVAPPPGPRAVPREVHDEFPELPGPLRVPGAHHDVDATICVSETGTVTSIAVASAGVPLLEQALGAAIRTWRYRALQVDGRPRPFCHGIVFAYRMGLDAGV